MPSHMEKQLAHPIDMKRIIIIHHRLHPSSPTPSFSLGNKEN